jgi:CBS domain-containing protein
MSPRAACRLETLGFQAYDYTAGKSDWLARGLPREGEKAAEVRAGDIAVDDVVTCGLEETIAAVRERVEASRYRFALVVSPERVVLGRLRRAMLEADGTRTAEEVMEAGPSTIRAHRDLDAVAERMRKNELTNLPVTDPDGRLLGVVRHDDLEAALLA